MRKKRTWPESLIKDIDGYAGFRVIDKDSPGFPQALEAVVSAVADKCPRGDAMLRLYYGEGQSLREIGDRFAVTPERVRQILTRQRRFIRHPSVWVDLPGYVAWDGRE